MNTRNVSSSHVSKFSPSAWLAMLLVWLGFSLVTSQANTTLTWDPNLNNGGAGSGNWDTTVTNTNWWNGASDVAWTQASATTGSNAAIFNGPSGMWNVTNDAVGICPSNMYVNASGYSFYGDPLDIFTAASAAASSALYVAPGVTVNFYCQVGNANNGKYYVAGAGSVVNFLGTLGASQPRFLGQSSSAFFINGGSASSAPGVVYILGPCYMTSGTWKGGASFFAGYPSGAAVGGLTNYTIGSLTVNGSGASLIQNSGSFVWGRGGGQATLTLINGTITVGTTAADAITLCNDNSTVNGGPEYGALNVYGGTVNSGAATLVAPIKLSGGGSGPGQVALLNQTNGTIYAYSGIQMGATSGSYTGGSALITNSGGYLYLGANGILVEPFVPPTNYATFSGGTIGALATWSSSIPITLATLNGNITFQCADNNNDSYNISLSGPLTGAGGLNVTGGGTLTLTGANNYAGSTMISNGTFVIATSPSPSGGPVTVDASAGTPTLSMAASAGTSWTITGLTYQNGTATADFNFGTLTPSTTLAPMVVNGNVSFASPPNVTVECNLLSVGIYPLIQYSGTFSGTLPSNLTTPGCTSGYLTNTGNAISLVITQSCITPGLYWAVGNGGWDFTSPDWKGESNKYTDGKPVTFDDTASGTSPITVTLNTTVNPLSVFANNTAKNYIITGQGNIEGTTGVVVQKGGTLALATKNSYTGGTILSEGTLDINNGGDSSGTNSAIGDGPLTIWAGTSIDNTSGANVTLQPSISETWSNFTYIGSSNSFNTGIGSVTLGENIVTVTVNSNNFIIGGAVGDNGNNYKLNKGGNGTLTLLGNNQFTGGLELLSGQINFGNSSAAGSGTCIIDGGIIDNVSGQDLTLTPNAYTWSGNFTYLGTETNIFDMGTGQISGSGTVTVVSNTLEWDGNIGSGNGLVTKTGAGTLIIGGVSQNGQTANSLGMAVAQGTVVMARSGGYSIADYGGANKGLIVESNALVLDEGNGVPQIGYGASIPVTLESGGILDLDGNNETVDSLTLNGGILRNDDTNNSDSTLTCTYPGNVYTLESTNQINVASTSTLTINAIIIGSGSYVMNGPGTLVLSSNNTYTGQTTIQGGTLALLQGGAITNSADILLAASNSALDLSQSTNYDANNNPELTLENGQILSGFGIVTGLVTTVSGATLAPGSSSTAGTLTVIGVNNDSNVLNGVTVMKLNKGGHTNDQLVVQNGTLVLGGTLVLTNLSGRLVSGDTFTLFTAAGGISGSFASITPASPGPGVAWNTANLGVNGTISIVSAGLPPPPNVTSVSLSGTTLTIQGTNGMANGQYVLLESTNLALPLANWVPVLTNSFNGSGAFSASVGTTNASHAYFTISEF